MPTAQLKLRPDRAADDIEPMEAGALEGSGVGASVEMDTDGSQLLPLPPAPGDDADGRFWRIPVGILSAEEHFYALLPDLLRQYPSRWVYVTSDGRYDEFPTDDEAELAALDLGITPENFVVRMVSVCELPSP
jgi:hypothetical protein